MGCELAEAKTEKAGTEALECLSGWFMVGTILLLLEKSDAMVGGDASATIGVRQPHRPPNQRHFATSSRWKRYLSYITKYTQRRYHVVSELFSLPLSFFKNECRYDSPC